MDPLREQVKGATIFTKFDLRDGYYLLRIKEGDEWKTAFQTQYGQFEYKVMPFGLCNAPATFQGMMNKVLREFLDQGVVVYLDNVLIYSKDKESYVKLVWQVLTKLAQYNLAVAGHKSQFHVPETEFLGFIVNGKGIHVSKETTKSVREWAVSKNLRGVRNFIGFANFYRRFIKNFSSIARPLTDLTKKDWGWRWGPEEQNAFDELNKAITTPPILKHFDPTNEIIIETDASNFAIGCILFQKWDDILHPVAFFLRKMEKAEKNYEIHDKELLVIVTAFKIWHHHCYGSPYPIRVLTDHNNLKYFMETTKFNQQQVRWVEKLAQYDFRIHYRPGKSGGKPDALSRRPEYAEGEEVEKPKSLLTPEIFVSSTHKEHPLLIKQLEPGAHLRIRGSDLAAGIDIVANEATTIPQGKRKIIGTGISIATPAGSYAHITPRSGLAAKYLIDIGAGVVNQDYRGEIKVLLINNSMQPYPVKPGDRISQLILEKILLANPQETNTLDKTARGNQGFGITGYQQNLTTKISSLTAEDFDKTFLERVRKTAEKDEEYKKELSKDPTNKQGLIFFQKRLRIPSDQELRKEILESEHDHPTVGHFG